MPRKHIIAAITLAILCALPAAAKAPNIVLLFVDDMGYGDIGPFGSTRNKTPNLDRMAKEGIKLTDFYVSSTACTPSRSALMTGCYAYRVGMDGRVVFPGDKRGLNPKEITIAEMLKARGYATGCFGKWHLGDHPKFMPLSQGFDEYVGIPYSNDMWPALRPKNPLPPLPFIKGNKVVAWIPDGRNQALLCDVETDATIDFIKRNKDKPFFAYVPYSYIHLPRFVLKARGDQAGGNVTRAQIEEIDASVGRIMSTLTELGIDKNTLVFFTSDNGGARGCSMGPLRGAKGGPKYEGHMREPTLAWWPGTIPPGAVSSEIGATIDLLPTLARLTGAEVPKDRTIDGKDILDVILGKPGAKSPHAVLYYEVEGVRKGKWKLVKVRNKFELYDLENDLGEKKDVAAANPEILKELKAILAAHAKNLEDDNRPAAFVDNPKPLLSKTDGVPTLVEYLGLKNVEIMENKRPPKKRKPKKKR